MGAFDKINLQLDMLIKSIEVEQQRRGNGGGSGSAGGLFSVNGDTTDIQQKIKDYDFDGLPTSKALSNKLESLKSKIKNKRAKNKKSKKQNKKGIFDDLLKTTSKILEAGRPMQEVGSNQTNQRLKQHVLDSIEVTKNSARQILMDCVREVFFAGDGICGGNSKIQGAEMDKVYIKPKEIDFLNMLRVDPESDYGKIMYEDKNPTNNKEKVNRGLYYAFTDDPSRGVPGNTLPYTYQYDTPSNKTLFVANWEDANQWFVITGLTQPTITLNQNVIYDTSVNVQDFFIDYYINMEMPDLPTIIKNAMLLTLKAASIESDKNGISLGGNVSGMDSTLKFDLSLDRAINDLERMLNKIFSFCGNNGNPGLKAQNPTKLFNENEEDQDFYFDFDDVEGIDLEDEDARLRKVLRFKDCGNFEVPYNPSHIEDFVYLEKKMSNREWIDSTLSKAAADAYEQSNFSIDLPSFKFSLDLSFLLNLPKALVMSIISPKMFIPIVTIYKLFVSSVNSGGVISAQTAPLMEMDSKEMMRKLKKLFLCIIDKLFWKFLREFWKRVKVDLKNFLQRIIKKILKEKFKRYYILISALIAILKKLIEDGIDNCQDLLQAIGMAIEAALNASAELGIPQPLLLLVGLLPGFSSVKTYIDTAEEMSKNGIPTGDVNGEPNYYMLSIASQINSFAKNLSTAPFMGVSGAPGQVSYSVMKPG